MAEASAFEGEAEEYRPRPRNAKIVELQDDGGTPSAGGSSGAPAPSGGTKNISKPIPAAFSRGKAKVSAVRPQEALAEPAPPKLAPRSASIRPTKPRVGATRVVKPDGDGTNVVLDEADEPELLHELQKIQEQRTLATQAADVLEVVVEDDDDE
jgi:hypothetical protein